MTRNTARGEQHLLQESHQHEVELQELLQRLLAVPLQPLLDRTAAIETALQEIESQLEEHQEMAFVQQSKLDTHLQVQGQQTKDFNSRLKAMAESVEALGGTLPATHQTQLTALGQELAERSSRGFADMGAQLTDVDHARLQPLGPALERVDSKLQQRMQYLEEQLQRLHELQLGLQQSALQHQAVLRGVRRVSVSLLALLALLAVGVPVLAVVLMR